MRAGQRVSVVGTHKKGRVVSEAPRSVLSDRRLYAVRFDGNPRVHYFTEDELRTVSEPGVRR